MGYAALPPPLPRTATVAEMKADLRRIQAEIDQTRRRMVLALIGGIVVAALAIGVIVLWS